MRRSSGSGTVKKATGKQATEAGNRKKSPKPNKVAWNYWNRSIID